MLQQVFGFSLLSPILERLAPIFQGLGPNFAGPTVPLLQELGPPAEWTVLQPLPLSSVPGAVAPRSLLPSRSSLLLPSRSSRVSRPSPPLAPSARIPEPLAPPHTGSHIPWPALSRKNPWSCRSTESASRCARPCNDATPAAPHTRALLRNIRGT